jgi:hypothetical protein
LAIVFKILPVVNWRSEGCDVTFSCLNGVVTQGSGILGSFDAVGGSNLSSDVILGCLDCIVLRSIGMGAKPSVC